jgi:protocatechuate 3,4-dioxygenase beta subunit
VGRPLARPEEDIEDQGLAFDLRTAIDRRMGRRGALGALGVGLGGVLLAACSTGSDSGDSTTASAADDEFPTETAGPYPGDGSNGPDVLEEAGIERSDLTTSIDGGDAVEGVAMTLTMTILDITGGGSAPMTNAAVYLWHCDAQGRYSMYSDGVTDATWLRGVQVTDSQGQVTFTTIVPGCYAGRWPHLHFEVFESIDDITDAANAVLTSQIALPEDVCRTVYARSAYDGSAANLSDVTLESDGIFSDSHEQQVATVTGSVSRGYTAAIEVPIDLDTANEMTGGGGAPGGPGGSSGGGGEGGGPGGGEPPEGSSGERPEGGPGEGDAQS